MTDELAELRADLAAARGLPPAAISFLTGSTAEEVEAQADRLAELLVDREAGQAEPEPPVGFFEQAFAAKAARKREVVALFTGRPQAQSQPRDEHGRFVSSSNAQGGNGKVWVNTDSKVYHLQGDQWYGKTKNGKYMTEQEAIKAGYRAAKNGGKE